MSKRLDPATAHAVFLRFMCRCLHLVEHLLPQVGVAALETATAHWIEGIDQGKELVTARVACWQYLDSTGMDIVEPRDAAIQALICVLYPASVDEDKPEDSVRCFAAMMLRAGCSRDEVEACIGETNWRVRVSYEFRAGLPAVTRLLLPDLFISAQMRRTVRPLSFRSREVRLSWAGRTPRGEWPEDITVLREPDAVRVVFRVGTAAEREALLRRLAYEIGEKTGETVSFGRHGG